MGVRNAAAEVLGPADFTNEYWGGLFEQWVGLSLLRLMRARGLDGKLHYWRDYSGREVDWEVDLGSEWIPIEVKWGENLRTDDLRHLEYFARTYGDKVNRGYVVFTGPRDREFSDKIQALTYRDFLRKVFALRRYRAAAASSIWDPGWSYRTLISRGLSRSHRYGT